MIILGSSVCNILNIRQFVSRDTTRAEKFSSFDVGVVVRFEKFDEELISSELVTLLTQ